MNIMSKIEKLVDKCIILLKDDNYPEVIKTCNKILEIDSDNEFALRFIAISNYHLKNYEESEKYLEKAYNNNPHNKKIIMDYGITLFVRGKLDKALTLYDFYFKYEDKSLEKEVTDYFIALSIECTHKNKIKDAIKCLDYYLEKNPNSIAIYYKKAELYSNWKPTHSLKIYEKILELDKSEINAIKEKLIILNRLNWYDKAYKYIKSLTCTDKKINDEISYIASILTENKKYSEAIGCYEKILELTPSEISAITNIRKIWDKANMKEAKKNSKYYMDWIEVILSHTDYYMCSEEGCHQRLSHIVHGINGYRLMEIPPAEDDFVIKDYIDCDENSTHYCSKCKKEYKVDVEGFTYNKDDSSLYEYAKTMILFLKHFVLYDDYYSKNYRYVQEMFHDEYLIDKKEFNAFINKLEKLNYLHKEVVINLE